MNHFSSPPITRPCDAGSLVRLTTYGSLFVLAIVCAIAVGRGLSLGIQPAPLLIAIMFAAALIWVWWRHERPSGDRRLADSALAMLCLFGGGLAGGLVCLIGQTFAQPFIDQALHQADLALGIDIPGIVAAMARVDGFPAFLEIAYNSSFPLIFGSTLALIWIGRRDRALELCGIFNACLIVTAIASALIPAAGAFQFLAMPEVVRSALPAGAGVYHLADLAALRSATRFVIDPTHLQGVATFPSFHTALALMTISAWRDFPFGRITMLMWQSFVILSTLAIGGHYGVDLLAGGLVWAAIHGLWALATRQPSTRAADALEREALARA
ncbi:MAG: phosphatase PAP2 family protein [Sphingomicrobium sp.]